MSEGAESYGAGRQGEPKRDERGAAGPDPVIGAGIALVGIFLMGAGGARDAHYVFDVGVVGAVVGAAVFVLFVTLSAMKPRRARKEGGDSSL